MSAPANFVSAQGVTVNADQINTLVQWCPSIAALRGFIGTSNMTVILLGASALNDSGQGNFYWNPTSPGPDDGNNVIVPTGVTQGAWIRLLFSSPPIFPSSGTVAAQCNASYIALGSFTLQLAVSTSVSKTCQINVFAYAGTVTIALLGAADSINGGSAGVSLVLPQGMQATIQTDANGHYYATVVMAAAQTKVTATTVTATAGNNYVASSAFTLNLPASTALSPNWFVSVFAQGGAVLLSPLLGTDRVNGSVSLSVPHNYYAVIGTDGNGHFYATLALAITGTNPSSVSSFSAYNGGAGSTIISINTWTKASLPNTVFNIGSNYNTSLSRWTPTSGRVIMTAQVQLFSSGFSAAPATGFIAIYKNGSALKQNDFNYINSSDQVATININITVMDAANGTDYYEMYVFSTEIPGYNNDATLTYFSGSEI